MSRRARILLLALLTTSCGGGEHARDGVVVLGAVLPLTGVGAGTGEEIVAGLELAAQADADGPRLTLRIRDGQGEPLACARSFRELASDPEVRAVVGGWFSSTARTLAAAAATADVSFVALSPLTIVSSNGGSTFPLHRLGALGRAMAEFARDDLNARRAGVFHVPGSEVSTLLADAFSRAFSPDGSEILWTITPDDSGGLSLPAGPEEAVDVIYVAGPGKWAKKCSELGTKTSRAAVLTAEGWSTEGLAELAEGDVSVYVASFFNAGDPAAPNRRLLDECARVGREPSPAVALGWDAAFLVRQAAGRGGASRDAIRGSLRSGSGLDGATGRLEFPHGGGFRETPAIASASARGDVFLRRVSVTREPGG